MDRNDRISLVGTIGTWIAVLLALIALIAVIGPVVVWAAAQTERNKALHDAGDTSQPFIGAGFHFVGVDVRILRRIRVPILDKPPEKPLLVWDRARFIETKSRASWVQLVSLLLGYGVKSEIGDKLVIYRGKTTLPVHRIWIMVIGLTGRYTTRDSRPAGGKALRRLEIVPESQVDEWYERRDIVSDRLVLENLHGTTGQIRIPEKVSDLGVSESSVATFIPCPLSEIAKIENETLSLQDLLMLAIGCLPVTSQQYMVMIDLWNMEELDPDYHIIDVDQPQQSGGIGELSREIRSNRREREEVIVRRGAPNILALRLENVTSLNDELERLRSTFGPMRQEILAFEPQSLDRGLLGELRSRMDVTFIEPRFEWIRLPQVDREYGSDSKIFVWRADAQKIAHGLYVLPWHPQGYLIGGRSSACCIRLLEAAGNEFLYLLTRVRENIDSLDIVSQERSRFKDSMAEVDKMVRRKRNGVPLPSNAEFYKLDGILSGVGHTKPEINEMIGVLMMTNEEFASFVSQSARYFDKSISGSLEVAMGTGHVKVKLPFGGMQEFPVDMEHLYPRMQLRDENITVEYSVAILACLRASMRSYLLKIRFDGFPLMREVLEMSDLVHVI